MHVRVPAHNWGEEQREEKRETQADSPLNIAELGGRQSSISGP